MCLGGPPDLSVHMVYGLISVALFNIILTGKSCLLYQVKWFHFINDKSLFLNYRIGLLVYWMQVKQVAVKGRSGYRMGVL